MIIIDKSGWMAVFGHFYDEVVLAKELKRAFCIALRLFWALLVGDGGNGDGALDMLGCYEAQLLFLGDFQYAKNKSYRNNENSQIFSKVFHIHP